MRIHIRYLLIAATILILSTLLPGSSAKRKGIKQAAIDESSSPHYAFAGRFQIPGFALVDDASADLGITKTASETVLAGSDLTYTIEVHNGGPDSADTATWNDPLPAGTTFVSLSGPVSWTCSTPTAGTNGTVNCSNPSFPVDGDDVFTLVVHVPSATEAGTFFSNTASVSTITFDPNDENNSSSAGTMVGAGSVDIGVTKTANSDQVLAGSDVTYTIQVNNSGPGNADNVTLNDPLPGNMTFVSLSHPASWTCTTPAVGAGGTVNCSNPSLAPTPGDVFTLVVHTPESQTATYTNTATVSTSTPDSNEENNQASTSTSAVTCLTVAFVNSNADSGPGSLRQAILDACPGATIFFSSSFIGPITLTSGELVINKNLTIVGPGVNSLTIGGNNASRVFNISSGTVSISDLTIANGKATPGGSSGGGLINSGTLTLTNCNFYGNSASTTGDGGGIYSSGPSLTLQNCNIGGTSAGQANTALQGAGIKIGGGTLTIYDSSIVGNQSLDAGGGLANSGGTVTLVNSTISGNTGKAGGGGIFNNGGTLNLTNVTVTGNRSDSDNSGGEQGGGILLSSGTATLRNTIVAGNFRGTGLTADDISGTVDASSSFNLIGTGGSGGLASGAPNNNQVGVANPGLGPLANNGGTTLTHALLLGSPALDAGSNALLPQDTFDLDNDGNTTETLPVDQRGIGFQRVADSADANTTQTVDIGAYEAQVSVEDISNKATNEDTPLSFTFNVGDADLITSVTATSSNTTLVPNNAANLNVTGTGSTRTLQINPAANLSGTTTITVTVNGSNSQTMSDTFVLTVNPINDAPVANSQSVTTNEDTPKAITLTGSDVDNGSLSYIIVTGPSHGALSGTAPNVTYTPAANYNGPDSFTFKINDGSADSNVATVSITVNAVNDAPQASNDSYSTNENATLNVPAPGVLTNDTDVEGSTLTAVLVSNPAHGTTTLNSNGSFTYVPQAGFSGPDSFTYKANDGSQDSNTATVTINVNEGGALAFSSATYSVSESGGSVTITITRTGGSAGTATVLFNTSNGTASTSDYTPVSQTLTFNDGESSKTVNVLINNDAVSESNETVNLTLSNAGGTGQLGTPSTAILTINDDDAQPALSINDVTQAEGNSGTTAFNFTVTLSSASGQTVTVSYATANGTATAPGDYQAASGVLTFNSGETTKTVTVFVNGDTLAETDENFFVNLSGAANATISDNQGVGTIISDDLSLIQFSSSSYNVAEGGLRATITVNRLGNISQPSSVDYATSDLSGLKNCSEVTSNASSRCDYAVTVGTLRFAANEASKTISIPIVNDVYVEGPESFTITLSHVVGGDLGSPSVATITIDDNDNGGAPNPIDDNAFFVRELYIDFLGREPDPPGLRGWLNILNNCPSGDQTCDRVHVAEGFARSDEFGERGYFIYRAYRAALGRKPGYVEFIPDMAKVSGFLTAQELEANKQAFINEFVTRTEFRMKYDSLDNSGYVNELEKTALVTLPNKQALIDDLNAGRKTRAQVLRAVMDTTEVYAKHFNEAFVVMEYFGFLRRDPDALYQSWIDQFNHSNSYRLVINGFINSDEYRHRFGP
ncbi:MAG TPA: Calx-beta domain-containing protein [Pyrinomonadaceae bacterium]|nr:Calx-beta domain-containing protein [Pyrinomonadaceae bacterium]